MIELDYINLTKWFSNLHLDKPSDKNIANIYTWAELCIPI